MSVEALYTAGLPGTRAKGGGATLELYLYSNDGKPMQGAKGRPVCNPCGWRLTAAGRKQTINLSALVQSAQGVKLGFGVIVVVGSDPDAVNIQGVGVHLERRDPSSGSNR